MAKADIPFTPATPLEERVFAGDYDGTLAVLRPLTQLERARHRASLKRMIGLMLDSGWRSPGSGGLLWPMRSTAAQDRAVRAAMVLCGEAKDVADSRIGADDVLPLLAEFELPCLQELPDAWLRRWPGSIDDVQALVVAGVVPRPDSDDYALGLMCLVERHGKKFLRDYIAEDPGLPAVLPRVFDVEGNADVSLANIDKFIGVSESWSRQLLGLCEDGTLDRGLLLDRTLGALERDWPQYRAGWFKGFHELLAPTAAQMQPHAARYLQLCHSRIPPTVTLALDALDTLEKDGAVEPSNLIDALAPVLVTGAKGQVETALKLLDRCVARDAALASPAARAAATALVHEAAPLQAKVLQRLEKWTRAPADHEELRRYLPGIAASHRARLAALIGEDAGALPAATPAPAAPTASPQRAAPLDPDRAIVPVTDLDELVQAIAYAFENDTDTDALERAFGALVVAAPIADADRARFGPVRKRVAKLKAPVAFELGRLLAFVLDGERLPPLPERDSGNRFEPMHRVLSARTEALIDLAAQGKRLVPLSTPTHQRGFIDPAELVRRQRALVDASAFTAASEQALALLRLAPGATAADRDAARALPDSPFARALRYALGDDIAPGPEKPLYCAAARIRHPGADDAVLLAKYGDLGPDGPRAARYAWEFRTKDDDTFFRNDLLVFSAPRHDDVGDLLALARHPESVPEDTPSWYRFRYLAGTTAALAAWSATLLPSHLEAFFAEGARELGNNLDWWEARWHQRVYLQPLLDPTVEVGPMGLLALACGLFGKEPGQTALAVDGLVRLQADGRLDVVALGETLRRMLASDAVKSARLRRSFDAALRLEPALAPVLVELTVAAVTGAPRKDFATLLELLHELLVASGSGLSAEAQRALGDVAFAGTAKGLQRKILALAPIP